MQSTIKRRFRTRTSSGGIPGTLGANRIADYLSWNHTNHSCPARESAAVFPPDLKCIPKSCAGCYMIFAITQKASLGFFRKPAPARRNACDCFSRLLTARTSQPSRPLSILFCLLLSFSVLRDGILPRGWSFGSRRICSLIRGQASSEILPRRFCKSNKSSAPTHETDARLGCQLHILRTADVYRWLWILSAIDR